MRVAYVTVVQSTRVCIHAATVSVFGRALSTAGCTAWAAVSDGVVAAENEYSVRGTMVAVPGASAYTATIAVPPYARFARLELDTETEYALSYIGLIDGWGTQRNSTQGDRQPNPGLPIGDSQSVVIKTSNPVNWRVTFLLNI